MSERELTPYGVERTVLRDPVLGLLRWNPNLRWWEGDLPGEDAALFAEGTEDPEPGYTQTIRDRATEALSRVRAAVAFAEARLAPFAGNPWPTPAHFEEAVSLASIALRTDGTAQIYLDDGDLFLGRSILVILDRDGTLLDAGIVTPA